MSHMKRKWFAGLVVGVVVLGGTAWFSSGLWFGGLTPMQTANILIEDRKFGMRALGMGHFWGDKLLDPLRDASNDFQSLDNRNAFWVAEILAKNKSGRSSEMARELFNREAMPTKLVGAIGLAAHGRLPKNQFQRDGTLQRILISEEYLYRYDSSGRRSYADTTSIELALIVAKHAQSTDSVEDIVALIKKRPLPYWLHAYAADALGAIGDRRAEVALEEAMRARDFYALPNAFRALISLNSKQAIPLAIDRISPEVENDNTVSFVHDLEAVTGQNFGFDKARWQEWWAAQAEPTR